MIWEVIIYMDIKQLKYFLAIAEEKNITKAAEKLYMAQPPLSYQLKLLEGELGVKLIERNTHRVLELLKSGIIEIGIIRTPFNGEIFESICLPKESMVAASSSLNWNEKQNYIEMTELTNKSLVIDRRFENVIVKACRKEGFEPKIICRGDDVRSILLWASTGIGTAIVPEAAIGLIPNSNLNYKEIKLVSVETQTAIIWMKNQYLSSAARHFLKTFKV